ncbi:unnamed protein product, partial [Symbiodinium sp. CCMP2456]
MGDTGVNPKLPSWDGDWKTFADYKLACWLEHDGLKQDDQVTLAPRLARNLTGKAWEACLEIEREKLRKEGGLEYLLTYLKGKRGKQQVDILGEAFEKYFQSGEVMRRDKETLNDYEQRLTNFTRDIERALKELGTEAKVPTEIYGWFLLNKHIRLEPSDIATLKSQTASYKLGDVLAALRKMWGGDSLSLKDQERRKIAKAYLALGEYEDEADMEGNVWWNEDGGEDETIAEGEPTEAEIYFEEALAAHLESPEDEVILANFQEAKRTFYKDARKALDQSRVSRGFYPKGKGKGQDRAKGGGRTGEFPGRCMRCGKYGHKAQACPQTGDGKGGATGKGSGVGFVYTNWTEVSSADWGATTEAEGIFVQREPETMKAIMDCGASESIVGAWTLQKMHDELGRLGFDTDAEIQIDQRIRKNFIFGNNETSTALGLAKVTAGIHGQEQAIKMHIVEGGTPMLLSSKWLYDQEAIVDFKRGQAIFPKISSEVIQLERAPTFHLLLPITAFGGNESEVGELEACLSGPVAVDTGQCPAQHSESDEVTFCDPLHPESSESSEQHQEVFCQISDNQKPYFKQALEEYEAHVVKTMRDLTSERVDLLEVCCPWDSPLSAAVVEVQRQELNGQSGFQADGHQAHAGGEQPLRAFSWKALMRNRDREILRQIQVYAAEGPEEPPGKHDTSPEPNHPEIEPETEDWKVLVRVLKEAGHAKPHRTSQIPHASRKWEVVSVDTFWWHSPHKDEKGNPIEHAVGISFLDEASDFHVASIVRTGSHTQRVINSSEFKETFCRDWLRNLPKPEALRFDDEGAFRDSQTIEWIEGQAIRVSVIAGEAAWQVGKHSRHLEVLKENMSLLALELGPEVKATPQISGALARVKNAYNRILATSRSCEANLFEGQLVYYYRKGRNTSRMEAGWHGPARVEIWLRSQKTLRYMMTSRAQGTSSQIPLDVFSANSLRQMSKQSVLSALKGKLAEDQKSTATSQYEEENQRCTEMSMQDLGNELVQHGKHQGKPVKEAAKDNKYVIWLMEHHECNVKFTNLLTYVIRANGGQSQKKTAGSSNDTPKPIGTEEEWLQVWEQEPDKELPGSVTAMVHVLQKTVKDLALQVGQLEQANLQQQQALYQAMSASMQLQEEMERIRERLVAYEEDSWETLPGTRQTPEPAQVFEIALEVQPRDVHKVQFRSLSDDDKLDFMKAMQSELSSYLQHEAVQIARRHNVPPERILKAVYGLLHAPRAWAEKLGVHVDDLLCCGAGQHFEDFSIDLNQERYAEGLVEIPLSRERRDQSQEPVNEQGCFKEATIDDINQVNKLIRLQRVHSQTTIHFSSQIQRPVLLTYHDASYACRSSTAAEIQTGSHAIDAHEFTKQMLVEWYNE